MVEKYDINCFSWTNRAVFLVIVLSLVMSTASGGEGAAAPDKKRSHKLLRSMARVYMAYGQYDKAQPMAEQALALAMKDQDSDTEVAMCLIDLATLYRDQGKLTDARRRCEQGLKLQQAALYEGHPHVAYSWRTLSSIYLEQDMYGEAAGAMDKAMAIMLESHSPEDKALAPFRADIANILVAQGKLQEAQSSYKQIMASINESYGPNHLYSAKVLANIAQLYVLQEKYDQAEKLIDQSIAAQEKIYGSTHHFMASSWMTKARICKAKGDHKQAKELIDRALGAVQKTGNATRFAKMQQQAREIDAIRYAAYRSIAKAGE